ncbi:hypothetical protein CYY_000417 [Polysphondylium violaceum]|uniref:F-box domain-containing protein n=1 Tax=Polysphondylium violaceum TaxID=133409 RepID=A0A8J4Q3Y6_9MYCE|nr:hypothetical protein CYY_000417 [Polysphondylium violaceum]
MEDISFSDLNLYQHYYYYQNSVGLLHLPQEVILEILSNLDANDIKSIFFTNQFLSMLCKENKIWKAICKRKWNSSPIFKRRLVSNWSKYYNEKMSIIQNTGMYWSNITPKGHVPSPRYQNTSSVIDNYIYYIGGQERSDLRFNDIYRLDTDTHHFEKIFPSGDLPPNFARHSAAVIGKRIYTFGGFDGFRKHYGLGMYDTESNIWQYIYNVSGDVPHPRTNHASCAIGDQLYVFGGMYKDPEESLIFLNDLYRLDTNTLVWTRLDGQGDVPPPKCGHRLFNFAGKLLLFGGGYGGNWDKKYNEIHIFDPSNNTWLKADVKGELPVSTFAICFPMGPFLFVFGGQAMTNDCLTNDLYMLDTINMEWSKVEVSFPPIPRDMGSGSIVGNTFYLFGGFCGVPLNSLCSLNFKKKIEDFYAIVPYDGSSTPPPPPPFSLSGPSSPPLQPQQPSINNSPTFDNTNNTNNNNNNNNTFDLNNSHNNEQENDNSNNNNRFQRFLTSFK